MEEDEETHDLFPLNLGAYRMFVAKLLSSRHVGGELKALLEQLAEILRTTTAKLAADFEKKDGILRARASTRYAWLWYRANLQSTRALLVQWMKFDATIDRCFVMTGVVEDPTLKLLVNLLHMLCNNDLLNGLPIPALELDPTVELAVIPLEQAVLEEFKKHTDDDDWTELNSEEWNQMKNIFEMMLRSEEINGQAVNALVVN